MKILFLSVLVSNLLQSYFVTCNLGGQLGNQFYDIAHMLAFAWDNNLIPVMPDIKSGMSGKENEEYFYKLIDADSLNKLNYVKWSEIRVKDWKVHDIHTHKNIEYELATNPRFTGFFETYRYFDKYKDRILDLFQLHPEKQNQIKNKFKDIFTHPNTVAVHIRTGDYPRVLFFPGLEFYYNKMATFDKQNTLFVVCSDRINWVKEKFTDWPFNIVYPDCDHITELYLMTQCKHIIMSIQSTYGFWAAYLNTNPNKKVFAHNSTGLTDWYPQEWYIENFPDKAAPDYPDMAFYDNKSLDNK